MNYYYCPGCEHTQENVDDVMRPDCPECGVEMHCVDTNASPYDTLQEKWL